VISPEDDDGVVFVRAGFQSVEKATYIHVGVGTGGEVGLDGSFPAATFHEFGMVLCGSCHADPSRWEVREVIFNVGRELDFIERKVLIVLSRCNKGEVGFIESAGDEEGLVGFFLESLDAVVGGVPIEDVVIFEVGVLFVDVIAVVLLDSGAVGIKSGIGHVVCPFTGMVLHGVVDLSGSIDAIA